MIQNDHGEKPKRLSPTGETLQALYLKSGNQCAFPGCEQVMQINETRSGQVCHIEDALPGGRWNSARTNEENRREANLILLCYQHHKITDDVDSYPTEELIRMKRMHEHRISKGISPTVLSIGGDGEVNMYGAVITGGAQVIIEGSGDKRIVNLDVDGGKNGHLSKDDFVP